MQFKDQSSFRAWEFFALLGYWWALKNEFDEPSLYHINTRVWLTELSRPLNRTATLDDIPDSELDHLAALGFDWIWFLSVWQTGSEESLELRQSLRSSPLVCGSTTNFSRYFGSQSFAMEQGNCSWWR
jgi:hypothetical protein